MKKAFLLLTFLAAVHYSNAQIQVKSISLGNGSVGSTLFNSGLKSPLSIAPNSQYLTNFDNQGLPLVNSQNYSIFGTRGSNLSTRLALDLSLLRKTKSSHNFRISAMNYNFSQSYGELYNNIYKYDTYVSPTTGNSISLDSISSSFRGFTATAKTLVLDLAYIYNQKLTKKFTVYTGFGFRKSIQLGNEFSSYVGKNNQVLAYNPYANYNYYYSYSSSNTSFETLNNVTGIKYSLAQIYVPLGLEYKLSKKSKLLNKFSLFTEITPSLNFQKFNSVKYNNLSIGSLFGLKFNF